MTEAPDSATVVDEKAIRFYDGALLRTQRITFALAATAIVTALVCRGWKVAVPLLIGAAIGWLNLRWLMQSSFTLLSKVQELVSAAGGERPANLPGGVGAVVRFLLRYVLLVCATYVIVMWSVFSILALFCGLFLPIAALMAEAVYEVWVSYRKGL